MSPVTKRSPRRRLTSASASASTSASDRQATADLTIAGVGASAGGLDAFTTLLKSLPSKPGAAIVFIQHLAPQHDSALVPLLSGQSALPVVQATEGLSVEADHVYV